MAKTVLRGISSFNRTSFQQQLKRASIKAPAIQLELQSYILSTTTETQATA